MGKPKEDKAMPGLLQVKHLRFSWQRSAPEVLNIPALSVTQGERLFIHGPSGSGKSSLLGLLAGINTADSGSINILGSELQNMSPAQRDHFRAEHIGYIFQQFNLLPYLSLLENVTLPCHFSKLKTQRAQQRSGSVKLEAQRLLQSLDLEQHALAGKTVRELSVGQQQRVAVARALIGAPELLIADEPTSALDSRSRDMFLELLFSELDASNTSLVFVSHDNSLAKHFDRVVALDEMNAGMLGVV